MSEQRFKSRIDLWIGLVVAAAVVTDVVFIFVFGLRAGEMGMNGALFVLLALFILLLWLTLRTYYAVNQDTLRVVCGPFRWRIPLDEITAVTPSRSWWSSPALSLDRLRIDYGDGRRVLVSPAEKQEFLQAIGQADHG